ncbi:MAG: hypothetical protein ACJ71W_04075 [Terriglobales bacterium]
MSDKEKKQTGDSEYWRYLEETSKAVSNWPDWMRGESSERSAQKCETQEGERDS